MILQVIRYKLQDQKGYAAMFYFFVMLTVLGILMTAFTILALKDIYLVRASSVGLKNMYANEGFIEDTIIRSKTPGIADTENGETLAVGDAVVTASLSNEESSKSYLFSSQINNKYFGNEVLEINNPGPSVKIKKWQDSQ